MLKLLLLLLLFGLPRLVLGFCTDVPTAQPPFDYAASEIRLRQALQRNGLDPLAMPQTPCQRKVDGFEGVLEPFCLLYARSSEASAGLWSECTLTVPTDYCLLVHVCLGCPSDGSCTAEHNSFVVLTPMAGTDESSDAGDAGDRLGRTAGPGGRWGELGGRVALELCAHRCSSALFAMPTNRLHVAFVPESIPPVHSFHALHSYVKVRYLAVPSARADAAAGDHYIQEWLEAGCDNGASGKFPPMPPHGIPADGNQAVISERSAMGPAPSLAERIVHLGGGYPVFRLVADDDEDGRHLLGELVHSYLQHWLPSPLRLRLRTRSLRLSYSRQKGHRPPPPPDGRADRGATSQPRRHCAPNYAVPRMAYPLESCQFELQGKSGRFYSPNFPDSYPELGWCSWNLQVRETQSIVVKICGFTGGDECCLHSDRLIFEESPRRNIMAMVLSCWGHDTYYYTPKGSGLSVLLVSGDRQALNSAAPRRFWGEYFVLDEWDTLDLSRLNCGESGDNSTLINVIRQPASDADSDRMVLLSSEMEDFVNQTPLDINSLTNEWDLEVNEDRGTEEGIQQDIPYHDVRYSPFELANETRHKTALENEFEQRLVPLGSKVDNVTSAILLEKNVPYISDAEVPKHITALPVLKNQTRLSMSVTVRDPSVNFHQTHNHVELPSPKSSGVNLRAAEAVNETPVAAAKAHTPGFLKPMLQSKLLGPSNVIQPTPSFLTKNTLASVLEINLISPTSVTMVTNSVKSESGIHNFPNAFSDKVLEDDVTSNTKGSLGPAFEIEPSFVQSQVMSQHFMQLNKVTTLAPSGSSTQTLPTDYHGVSVDRYPSSRTAIGSESRGTAQAFDNLSQSSTRTSLLWKMSELVKGTKRRVASSKQKTRASAVASLIKSQPLLAFPVEASLRGLSHNAIKNKSIFGTRATRIHKGRYLQASRTRWHSFPLAGTYNVLTKPSVTAQARVVATTTQSLIHSTTVTTSATAERTISDVSVASNRLSILPEAASGSPLMYSAQLFPANKSDVWSPKPVIRDFMPTESVGISSSTVTANGTSSSDGPFPTAKNEDKPQSLDIGTGPFRPREYTWFEMSVDSMLQKKAREGLSFGRIVRLLSSHLSQLMEKNASDYYGSSFLSVLPRQAGWVAQGLQVQTKFHVFFRHLPRASARQLQRSLRNLPGQHLESADGALRLQLLSIDVTDVDECDVGEDLCDANAFCHNMVGSYVCFCNENYINLDPAWKGTQCQSVLAQVEATGAATTTAPAPTEAPEVAALVSPLAVALGSAACILVLLVLVGVAVSSVAVKGRRRRRRLRLEANGFSCTSTPAIYFHRRWEDWDPPPAPTLSDATLVSQPRVGPPMVSASSISAPDNLASLNGGTSTGGQWRASASADV